MMATSPGVLKLSAAFLMAIICQLIPFFGVWTDWKPNFILVLTITLILNYPDYFGVSFASISGLFADVMLGTIFGHFMLVFTLCGGLVCVLARWASHFALTYRLVSMFAVCLIAGFLQSILVILQGLPVPIDFYTGAAIISVMVLPIYEKAFNLSREP